ncbi:unnamed protein product [Cyclocybe aegerita]|uniref:Csf1 N-terminal domain-containing protein n=1 Tax=Cyclocybe aegerita TaxID=1973307 RepID=A0A8S0XGE9_CYCAE|nr:unnamed protein product [Cyclocybe aegerita]
MFDSLLLVACVCIVAALTLYFFYWNRFVAFLIGQTVRILYWNQEASSIWVEIGSIHFSLIAGRILFKDLRYHSSNQTIKILKGQIQWRYWIRRPTSEEEISSARGEDAKHSAWLWSCRIQISFQGVEWFLYNRTAAYDNIISQMEKNTRPTSRSSSNRRFLSRFTRQVETASPFYPPSGQRRVIRLPTFITNALNWLRLQLPNLDPKDLLPLGIDVQTGVIILGNPSTPGLLVAEFQHAFGTYGVVPSKSKFDLYKQVLGIKFQHPLVRLIKNEDYIDPMAALGGHIYHRIRQHATLRKPSFYQPHRAFVKIWRQLRLYSLVIDFFATRRAQHKAQESIPGFKKAKGAEDDTPLGIDFSAHEYAIERKILEAPALELTYYIDAVGEVPEECEGPHGVGKGDTSPEWGFDIVIYGGTLRYGPWADRQRAELQRIFFPPTYQNNELSPELRPGDKRAWGALQVFVELRDDTTLYIPFREASKDWQWDGQVEVPQRPRRRESAFISVTVGDQSSINYVMPMFVGPSGYESTLEVHLDAVTVTSSLNDIRLISGESCRVRGEMPACINWDGERAWTFSIFLRQPILFLLRDHINMFTDLGRDWVSGPPTDYQKFIPMIYDINLEMHHFDLNLYANDQNIIDKPLIREENAMISLRGPHLKNSTTIPSNVFRPESTPIPFTVIAPDLSACFFLPRWNTHALPTLKDGIPLFTTELFQINASYRYFAEVHDENVEQLKLDISMKAPLYRMYGWSIRYFMVLRDNYLGSFTHFQTLSEYLGKRKQNQPVGDPIGLKYRPGKSNMLQTQILLHADQAVLLMPTTLVGCAGSTGHDITFAIPDIRLQFRMHDYYMEMTLKLDTARGYIKEGYQLGHALSRSGTTSEDIFMIDGVDITANRLFGPQPRTATYVCIWEITIGRTKASMSARHAQMLTAALTSFRLNFVDLVNAPAADFVPTIELDVSFYKITIKSFEATWKAGHAALLVQLSEGLKLNSNDLGTRQYRKVSSLRVPDVSAKVLLAPSVERNLWLEAAEFVCDAYLDIYAAPMGHRVFTRAQLAFIEEQDKGTGRARRLFEQLRQRNRRPGQVGRLSHRNSVYLPQPSLPSRADAFTQQRPTQYQPPPHPRPASWRLSTLATMSDSEGEEGVSEADRDARLARTRTSTPVPRVQEEDVMSSGDESDDADLTEGEYSEDDWSDIGDSSDEGTNALMSFYSNIIRHYAANRSDPPGLWEGPLFIPTRGRAPFIRRDEQDNLGSEHSNHGLTISPEQLPKYNDLTTFRLKGRKAAKILCTPLILPAVVQFEADIKSVASDPQMCMDSLLADCISRISFNDTTAPKSSVANVSIPRVSFQIVQNIAMSNDGRPNVFQSMHSATVPSNLDILTLITLDVSGISFSGLFSSDLPTFKASVDQLITEFEISTDRRTLQAANPKQAVFKLSIASPSFGQSPSGIDFNTGSMSISIGHQAPELVSAASIALLPLFSQVGNILKGLVSFDLMEKRSIMGTLLNASEDKPVIDPLSTIQPSYLVQFGIPHSLRADVSFRFLYHLRNCITTTRSNHCDGIGLKDLVASTEARLALLDQDASNISDLAALDPTLFSPGAPRDTTLQKSHPHLNSIHVCIVTATIAVRAPDGPSSELVIKNTSVKWQSQSLDLVQFNFSNPSGASQSSLRSKTSKVVKKAVALLSFGDVDLEIAPHLMDFAQHVLRVKKQIGGKNESLSNRILQDIADRSSNYVSKFSHHEIIAFIRRLRIRAAAENLVVVMGMNGIQTSITVLVNPSQRSRPINSSLLFDEIYLQARSPANPAEESDQDVLASIALTSGRSSAILRPESGSRTDLKLIFCLSGLRLRVPRSALRLYRFVEEWRADYLPGIEATVYTLLSEYKSTPIKELSPTPSRRSRRRPIVQIHGQVDHFEISLQVMHGTWLSWQVQNTLAYFQSSSAALNPSYSFGLQTASMIVSVSSKPNAQDVAPSSRLKLVLPPLSLGGQSDGYNINMRILLRFIDIKVKPSHWDTILAVQQKFGQDFNDLVALMQKTRRKDPSFKPLTKGKNNNFQYVGQFKMQGFRIGLEGVSSVVYLECQDINGGISSEEGWKWDVGLSDLAFSLAPRMTGKTSTAFSRNHRSAFVTIDFKIGGSNIDGRDGKSIYLSVTKTHAVMQPSSIGEFGDFIDNLQAEMLERQEQRALQLATFKEKTGSILQTFDVNINDAQFQKSSWINDLVVSVSVRNIGVAFPLSHDEELQLPRTRSKESVAVRAFLFSIKSIEFESHRGETGQAMMKRLSFQFVSQFRQSSPEDFAAENHSTSNCLLYPEMQAQLRSSSVGLSRKFWIKAEVNGFVLDIDSTIPSYVFALIDVYRQGKDRVDRLSAIAPRTPLSPPSTPDSAKPSPEKHYTTIPTSNIFVKLTFRSGKVRLHSGSASDQFKKRISASSLVDLSDDLALDLGVEVFNLPVVSVWGEYRTTPASQKISMSEHAPSDLLVFNSTVSSSQNTLRPTLLPFMTELVNQIEMRMRKVSSRVSRPPSLAPSLALAVPPGASLPEKDPNIESMSSMQICFSLRIDQSKLELTCQPDVNVVAGLHWESGGFVLNVSPGARKVAFSGSVGGLTVGLKHGFLSEDCVKLDARNLTFSVSFAKTDMGVGDIINSISVALDTEFSGGVRFSRLQDILCFKAVWLDRIPILNNNTQMPTEVKAPARPASSQAMEAAPKRGFSTSILLRIRRIALDIDLGQSITRISLELNQTIFRTQLADILNEVFFYVGDVSTTARGNISGRLQVPSCIFQTIRRTGGPLRDISGLQRMLELRLTSGALVAVLESEHQKLLHYQSAPLPWSLYGGTNFISHLSAEPLEVEIYDDWSKSHSKQSDDAKPPQLSFTINSPEVVAVVTIGTIPKLMSYANKFKANLDAQRQGASRESQTFRVTRTPKPENPLSAVAEAMLHSARSRFKEAESDHAYIIQQHMSLRLGFLRLAVFPRTMRDLEVAQFTGRDVAARLDGIIGSGTVSSKRDLQLSFSSMIISRYTQVAHEPPSSPQGVNEHGAREWLTRIFKDANEATIVGLPSMMMHMTSEEANDESSRTLVYDFHSEFVRRVGMKDFEDIYITLNMSLYAWLTVLRKNLAREMEQVRATEDWRTSMSSVSTVLATAGSQRKKKAPEPLSLTDVPRSATLPSASTISLSPPGPSSARYTWMDHNRTPQTSRDQYLSPRGQVTPTPLHFPSSQENPEDQPVSQAPPKRRTIAYQPRNRHIERLTMRQLGDATPDVMHPFFMKKAGFSLEDSLPQYVHEYATTPLEEIMEVLMKLYSQQLLTGAQKARRSSSDAT